MTSADHQTGNPADTAASTATSTTTSSTATTQPNANTTDFAQQRKKWLLIVAVVVVLAALIYGVWLLFFDHSVSTDNAYVGADSAAITSMVTGQVSEVLVKDTQNVKKGQLLLRIDPRDAEIALAQAQAELAKAKRMYQQSSANSASLSSQVAVKVDAIRSSEAQYNKAKADLNQAQQELARRASLAATGAISKEELSTAQANVQTAQANVNAAAAAVSQAEQTRRAALNDLAANNALIADSSINTAPDVLAAQANVQQAALNLARSEIRAPFDGVIARRNIQVGQRVAPGSVLMMVVPVTQLFVDANFKESQLNKVRVGQSATLTSDLYGSDVVYHGKVIGFSGGTGSAFALIPAQNATGNWIKVVQRLPVRIALDPKELAQHPLRVGLSMEADIDLSAATQKQ